MNYLRPELLDELAARYVVGTMGAGARQRFESLCVAHPAARNAVRDWQNRLQPLADQVLAIKPPRRVWRSVQATIKQDRQPTGGFSQFGWHWASGVMAMLALVFGMLWWQQPPPDRSFAALLNEQGQVAWSVTIDDADRLQINTRQAPALSADQRHELWVLSGIDGVPVSLGLLPRRGEQGRLLTPAQIAALNDATTLAVSIEPATGSPTGVPSGPVILTAPIALTTS